RSHALKVLCMNLNVQRSSESRTRLASSFLRRLSVSAGESNQSAETTKGNMIATFQVHKQTYGHWPAKNGKPAGESFDLDLIDMSTPAEHAYRGVLPYRLTPEEKEKYWGKVERKSIQVAVHEIQTTQRGPVLRGAIVTVNEK